MRGLIDCHLHTRLCGHASGTPEDYAAAAELAGLDAIVFTEHLPLPDELDADRHLSMCMEALPGYCAAVEELRTRYDDLEVVLGAEVDWLPEHTEHSQRMREYAASLGVDVFLGSVHFLDGWAFDDPGNLAEWDTRDVDEVWRRYIDVWCDAALEGAFDVMAHPDLPKKFGHLASFDPAPMYRRMAEAAAEGGVIVEASTAGLRRPVGEIYPAPALLRAFAGAGVDVTVGSDAHAPAEVGFAIVETYEILRECGFSRIALPLGDHTARWYEL